MKLALWRESRIPFLPLFVALLVAASAGAFERGFPNLDSPYLFMEPKTFELSINHRFYGKAFEDDPLETFFGMDDGANVAVGLRYFYTESLDFQFSHTRVGKQLMAGAGWNEMLSGALTSYIFAGYISEELNPVDGREGGFLGMASVSAYGLAGNIRPVIQYVYDGIDSRHGLGFGLELGISETSALIGEYFPVLDRDDAEPGTVLEENAFNFGARVNSWGHQFLFILGNGFGIGARDQMDGATDTDLYLGFSIRRLLSI
jgi:hypothetical protein